MRLDEGESNVRVTCLKADTYKIGTLSVVPSDECDNYLRWAWRK